MAWVGVRAGLGRTDQAVYAKATLRLDGSVRLARSTGDQRALAYALAATGRLRLIRGEYDAARVDLDLACETAEALGWTSFPPFPRALRAEVLLGQDDRAPADRAFDHSYALACQVADPCWESYSLRGRGVLAAAMGDDALALDLLTAAPVASRRRRDAYDWVEAHCMDALCEFAVPRGLASAAAWVDDLENFASRRGMRELIARAALHRSTPGQPGAHDLAALLVAEIDNPALVELACQRA